MGKLKETLTVELTKTDVELAITDFLHSKGYSTKKIDYKFNPVMRDLDGANVEVEKTRKPYQS